MSFVREAAGWKIASRAPFAQSARGVQGDNSDGLQLLLLKSDFESVKLRDRELNPVTGGNTNHYTIADLLLVQLHADIMKRAPWPWPHVVGLVP